MMIGGAEKVLTVEIKSALLPGMTSAGAVAACRRRP